jgi:hypothetical protein
VASVQRDMPDSSKNPSTDAVGGEQDIVAESSVQYIARTVRFPDEPPTAGAQLAAGPRPSRQ